MGGARRKLNQIYLNGSLVLAALAGWLTRSWPVFFLAYLGAKNGLARGPGAPGSRRNSLITTCALADSATRAKITITTAHNARVIRTSIFLRTPAPTNNPAPNTTTPHFHICSPHP